MFYAQLITANLLNPWMSFDFENIQPFSKNQARKIKFRQFTCIKIGNARLAEKVRLFYHSECFQNTKTIIELQTICRSQ